MGKKAKKLLNKVTKVATLGLADTNDVLKVVDPFGMVQGASDQFLGTDFQGLKADAKDAANATAAREQQAATFAQNMGVDLGTANVANVEVGGTAATASTGTRRKRRAGASASSSLGINV